MGYIDEIQKINKLAKDLMNNRICTSLDEAIIKAKSILDKESVSNLNKTIENQPIKEEVKEAVKKESNEISWQEAMKRNNQYIIKAIQENNNELNKFRHKINSLEQEIQILKSKLNSQNNTGNVQENDKSKVNNIDKTESQSHPRQGNFKENDVSIDKIFYFGNK